jgi:hypothetical protein
MLAGRSTLSGPRRPCYIRPVASIPPDPDPPRRESKPAFQIVFVIAGLLIFPAALTLRTVLHPAVLQLQSNNPTPQGYTWSLLLFIVPTVVLGGWFARRSDLALARRAFWRTIAVLAPTGFGLDLLFGNAFFTFENTRATLGLGIPARGGPIPVEEFVFYLTGFMLVLLSYIWGDEYWVRAYNVPDYHAEAQGLPRLAQFHLPSVLLGAGLIAVAVVYKKVFSASPTGFPWYFIYLTVVAIVPSAGFFRTVLPFINWRAFSLTLFLILLLSLLWEVTLAIPYGWWGYRPATTLGLTVGAWWQLPIEAVGVWLAVSYATVITYEVIKIWQALGLGALEAFFGTRRT